MPLPASLTRPARAGGRLAAALTLALGSIACGQPAPAPTPSPTPAPTATVRPTTAPSPLAASPVASPPAVPEALRARLGGQASLKRARFSVESVTSTAALGATAPITTTGQGAIVLPDQVQVKLGGPAYASVGDAEFVALGADQLYLRLGQQWLALDSSPAFASLLPFVSGTFNPERALQGVSNVRPAGTEAVRGVDSAVYEFDLAPPQLQQPNLPGAQGIAATWERGTGRVWLSAEGRITRLRTEIQGRTAQGAAATGSTTLEFFDFDDPTIAIVLPAGATPAVVGSLPSPVGSPAGGRVAAPSATPSPGR